MSKEKRTFFISGHRDLTLDEFYELYAKPINHAICEYDAYFLIGDYIGCDAMAQNYIVDNLNYDPNKITVCHMGSKPMNINHYITNTVGNFKDDISRDSYMTENSDEDIAFVRKGKKNSGTEQNIIRRVSFDITRDENYDKLYKALSNLNGVYISEEKRMISDKILRENPYSIIMRVNDFKTLSIIGRVFDRRYSGTSKVWNVNVVTNDCRYEGYPLFSLYIHSDGIYEDINDLNKDTDMIVKNIDYWSQERFNNYFK